MQKQPNPVPARNSPEPASDDPLMEFIIRNKGILIVAFIIIVLIFATAFFYTNYSTEQEMEAWAVFNRTLQGGMSVESLTQALSQVGGTSAEPWGLYLLSIQYFKDGKIQKSEETFDQLHDNFADHYLLQNPQLAPSFREKLLAELDWVKNHPLPVKEVEAEEAAESAEADSDIPETEEAASE
jgi:hypothetical protein